MSILISILTGIMSPLVWAMYADVADYSEHRFHTASTGLIFSSSSMAQKFGGAIGGAAVLWLLSAFGYVASADASVAQPEAAVNCLWALMKPSYPQPWQYWHSWQCISIRSQPSKVKSIADDLRIRRNNPAADEAANFNEINA